MFHARLEKWRSITGDKKRLKYKCWYYDMAIAAGSEEAEKENFMKSSNRDDGWLTGRLYFNREDKRVIIKRPRSGFGYTMNLGNKWTWTFSIFFVIIIVILVSAL